MKKIKVIKIVLPSGVEARFMDGTVAREFIIKVRCKSTTTVVR